MLHFTKFVFCPSPLSVVNVYHDSQTSCKGLLVGLLNRQVAVMKGLFCFIFSLTRIAGSLVGRVNEDHFHVKTLAIFVCDLTLRSTSVRETPQQKNYFWPLLNVQM